VTQLAARPASRRQSRPASAGRAVPTAGRTIPTNGRRPRRWRPLAVVSTHRARWSCCSGRWSHHRDRRPRPVLQRYAIAVVVESPTSSLSAFY